MPQDTASLSACTNLLQDRILEVQQRRGGPSGKHKTGTMVLVLESHLPSASSKSIDITDQASFSSTDTVIITNKIVLMAAERNSPRVHLDRLHDEDGSRASWSCWSFHMHLKRTSMCALILNPQPPPPLVGYGYLAHKTNLAVKREVQKGFSFIFCRYLDGNPLECKPQMCEWLGTAVSLRHLSILKATCSNLAGLSAEHVRCGTYT